MHRPSVSLSQGLPGLNPETVQPVACSDLARCSHRTLDGSTGLRSSVSMLRSVDHTRNYLMRARLNITLGSHRITVEPLHTLDATANLPRCSTLLNLDCATWSHIVTRCTQRDSVGTPPETADSHKPW